MEKASRVPQVYGYTVCVIAVVTFLICATVIVNNVFDLANPIQAGYGLESSLSSFEAYQATYQRDQRAGLGVGAAAGEVRPDTCRRRRCARATTPCAPAGSAGCASSRGRRSPPAACS